MAGGQEKTWAPGAGPAAKDGQGRVIGNFVYAVLQDPRDISIIQLNATGLAESSPQMCHFGGPTRLNTSVGLGDVLEHYGNGMGIGDVLPARSTVALTGDANIVTGVNTIAPGDSGSAIDLSSDGSAVGIVVAIGIFPDVGQMIVTRLAPQLAHANTVMGRNLTLLTAARL